MGGIGTMHAGGRARCGRVSGCAHGPTIDLTVDPVCQVTLVLHFLGEVFEDFAQEPPDCVRDIADTRVAYVTDQPVGVDGYGVYHLTIGFQVQYAGCGFVLMDLYLNYPGVLGIHMSDAAVTFLRPTRDGAEAVHQVATGVGECLYPGMTVCLVSHIRYNTISGVVPEKWAILVISVGDRCGTYGKSYR